MNNINAIDTLDLDVELNSESSSSVHIVKNHLHQQLHDHTEDYADDIEPPIQKRNKRTQFIYEFYRKVNDLEEAFKLIENYEIEECK
ncbi:hypothetical protein BpHYR1_003523 [Brachionus plicatilis]|uniref:Uncharacterized protein n=1 Tax=Brachionus plicatilis TaxID=10195 RepID=A0A3M7RUX5_BRAPC|nr:hypothetical protein BpHYR1_003523 [Brachionus plicatilis]